MKTVEQIETEIKQLEEWKNTLLANFAQPYVARFKKHYLWTDDIAERHYKNTISQIAGLLIEKRKRAIEKREKK